MTQEYKNSPVWGQINEFDIETRSRVQIHSHDFFFFKYNKQKPYFACLDDSPEGTNKTERNAPTEIIAITL